MIIKFEFSINQLEEGDRAELAHLFSEASRASLLGCHRIVISRSVAKWCACNLDLTKKHKQHIISLGQNYAQLGGQYKEASRKVLVVSARLIHEVGL